MKKLQNLALLLFFTLYAFANDSVLIRINDHEISASEFARVYKKNNTSTTIDNKTAEEYLELYINFKLKVFEAESLGYDTLASFINEFESYRKQLVKPYFVDREAEENLISEAYERMKQEVEAGHIMIRLGNSPSPEDTLAAYQKISDIRKRILNGESFEALAYELSEDQSARDNQGKLGYFSSFDMVYPFENAAFSTQVGEISKPVRTSFGYHIVKVYDVRQNRGKIKVAHIMKMTPKDADEAYMDSIKKEIYKVYDLLNQNYDFAELAKIHSDDKSSAPKGGELPWFSSTDRIIDDFKNGAFALTFNGEISKPVQSPYGWHIIKRIDHAGLESFNELKDKIAERIKRDGDRNKLSEEMAANKLKTEYDFNEDLAKLEQFIQKTGGEIFLATWDAGKTPADLLFSFDGQSYTLKDLALFIEKDRNRANKRELSPSLYIKAMYKDFVKLSIFAYEETMLDKKYPDYKYLVKEYHDGILLFNLTDERVWSKAIKDTVGLKAFFDQNRDNYKWDQRAKAAVYSSENKKVMSSLRKALLKQSLSDEEILSRYCDTVNINCISIENKLYLKGDNNIVDKSGWVKGVSKVMPQMNRFYLVRVMDVIPPQKKEFEEAAGLITSDYQNYLDQEWIKELRDKYHIKVNKGLISEIQ